MQYARLNEAQGEIKLAGRSINNLRYADDTTLMAKSKEELTASWWKWESEKADLKLNIQKTKIMAFKNWKQWQTLFCWAPKSLGNHCGHYIKGHLRLGRKAMTHLDSILKSRDISLLTKVCLVKAMVFPVVMNGCETWTIKKAERWRVGAFELWCWRRL